MEVVNRQNLEHARELASNLKKFAASDFGAGGDRAFDTGTVIEAQTAALERVLALHHEVPVQFEEYSTCHECITQSWPCATVQAVTGGETNLEG